LTLAVQDDKSEFDSYRCEWTEVILYGTSIVKDDVIALLTQRLRVAMAEAQPSWQVSTPVHLTPQCALMLLDTRPVKPLSTVPVQSGKL
jgi:hypothetical protein